MATRSDEHRPSRLFYVYAKDTAQDQDLLDQMDRHLSALAHSGLIERWHAGLALAGDRFQRETLKALDWADLLVLLVSADCLASDECRELVQRARGRGLRVVPVLIRAVDVTHPILQGAVLLPLGGKAVTSWQNRDEAFTAVAHGLRQLLSGTSGAAAPAPLIGAHTTGREALRIALRLDRTKQWEQLKVECSERRHALFLLFGYKKQNLGFFLDRIRHYLAEERRDHHLVLDLPWDRGGETSVTGVDLLSRLDQQLARALSSAHAAVPVADRLRQVTALRPLLVIIGENPIDELPKHRNRALAEFLGHELPAALRGLGTPHPVRVFLCVDYLDPARSHVRDIAAWAGKAAGRRKDPGLHYCQLPEAVLPDWPEVDNFLRGLDPPLPQKRIQKIRAKYDELHRMDTPNFYQIAQILNTELGD